MEYWVERNLNTQNRLANQSIKATERQLKRYYQKVMQQAIEDFESTYNHLLIAIGSDREPTPADLYKLDKYWKLQNDMKVLLQDLGDKQAAVLSRIFTDTYKSVYDALAIPDAGMFHSIETRTAQQMINKIWCADGKSWIKRIWENTERLQQALNESLIDCVVAGRKTRDLKNLLIKEFGVSYSRSEALVRTEIAHIQTQAAKQRYMDSGITEVEVWADKDERRCDVCGACVHCNIDNKNNAAATA